jgi:contact-dependent growth inhibition (CDI) system CdiI-like immunity protein
MSTKASHKDVSEITASTFPALRSFMRGYFHEDMLDEYGTLEEAVRQFCEDADTDERKSVSDQWHRFVALTKGQPLPAVNKILTEKLGSACRLQPEDFDKISRAFQGLPPD